MTTIATHSPTLANWIKIIAALGVVWYAFGLLQFWLGFTLYPGTAVSAGTISQAHAHVVAATPLIIWLAFAMATSAGLIGAALLFARSPASKIVFGVSLLSAAAYYLWVYILSGAATALPTEELIIGAVVIALTPFFFQIAKSKT